VSASLPPPVWTPSALRGAGPCACNLAELPATPPRVVLTGGPGGGKTAVLEVVRRHFCEHIIVLPEAASILFGGGFPRGSHDTARRAAQRAIYCVEDELERLALAEGKVALVLCDRGVVDGAAYWPGPPDQLFAEVGTTREAALGRYAGVVHLRTPDARGYDHKNPVRTESASDAAAIDARIAAAWDGHPQRAFVEAEVDFVQKVTRAIAALDRLLPQCCRTHTWSPP
jgi:predicted ATPase